MVVSISELPLLIMEADSDYDRMNADSEQKRYCLWFTVIYLGDSGSYADFDNEMISFSAEFGRKFMSESGWFIEPQLRAQYTYITDVSYTAESGTAVDIDGIDSLIGRVGFRSGRSLSDPPLTFLYALRLDA